MIKARFEKATPTQDGITYVLKGERTKDALRAAVDLDNEDCVIELADKTPEPSADTIPDAIRQIWSIYNEAVRDAFAAGGKSKMQNG